MAGPTRAFLIADEQAPVMVWFLEHRGEYKGMTKVRPWALCADFIKEEFTKNMLHPGRMVITTKRD